MKETEQDPRASFGIILATWKKDVWMLKAAVESVVFYCPEVPICVVVDGDLDLGSLPTRYGIQTIYRRDISDPVLTDSALGAHPKMLAFWYSPFDRFLFLDADTLMWGNLPGSVQTTSADVIVHQREKPFSEEEINRWFFNTKQIAVLYPNFSWKGRPIENTGVFFARCDLFDRHSLREVLLHNHAPSAKDPSEKPFKMGEQGYLSFLFLNEESKGNLVLASENLQYIACDHPLEEQNARFSLENGKPPLNVPSPVVLHFAGPEKPTLHNSKVSTEAFSWFRRAAMKKKGFPFACCPRLFLAFEDFLILPQYSRSFAGRIRRRVQIFLEPLFLHLI